MLGNLEVASGIFSKYLSTYILCRGDCIGNYIINYFSYLVFFNFFILF
jgi:hypothetical protein